MSIELIQTIARLRRAISRTADVMSVCDALEAKLIGIATYEIHKAAAETFVESEQELRSGRFDRNAYQRDYMRKRRAKAKANASS